MGPFKDIGVEKTSHVATDGSKKRSTLRFQRLPPRCRFKVKRIFANRHGRSTTQPGSALAAVARLNRTKKTNAPLLPGVRGRPDYFKPK